MIRIILFGMGCGAVAGLFLEALSEPGWLVISATFFVVIAGMLCAALAADQR
jgi:hypothetical protein